MLRRGAEHPSEHGGATAPRRGTGDPKAKATVARVIAQALRRLHQLDSGGTRLDRPLPAMTSCPVPEVARLGRPPRSWRAEVLAYRTTSGTSTGPTEAVNLLLDKVRRIGHGHQGLDDYRLRLLLCCRPRNVT